MIRLYYEGEAIYVLLRGSILRLCEELKTGPENFWDPIWIPNLNGILMWRLCQVDLEAVSSCYGIYTTVYLVRHYLLLTTHSVTSYGVILWGGAASADSLHDLQGRAVSVFCGLKYRKECR
nr:unnamed protein product [Callosobruchus analis]